MRDYQSFFWLKIYCARKKFFQGLKLVLLLSLYLWACTLKISALGKQNSLRYQRTKLRRNFKNPIFAISFSSLKTNSPKTYRRILMKTVDIDSKRLKLSFDKKLAKSLEPFLRYSTLFLINLQKPVFRVFDPFKVEFDLRNLHEELRFSIIFPTSGRRALGKHFSPSYRDFSYS